jgi:uncharacterized protein YjfI (DUF2170 family)
MNITLELDSKQYKDLTRYCELNKFIPEDIVKKSYLEGFSIEKYGLLGNMGGIQEKRVEIEVIREKRVEIPVEVIKEVVKIEYVEVPVEVIKEVFVEVPVEKEVVKEVVKQVVKEVVKQVPVETIVTKIEYISDKTSENELLLKIQQLESEGQVFSTKLQECNDEIGIFSTKTTEMENIFQDKMSKKDEELDRLRQELDKQLDRPPVEKIVEVVVEKELTDNSLKPKLDALQNTLAKVRQETLEKDKKIRELEQTIQEIQKFQDNKQAVYLKGSNLDDKLYK